jgi:hypothetical protein
MTNLVIQQMKKIITSLLKKTHVISRGNIENDARINVKVSKGDRRLLGLTNTRLES